MTAQRPIRLLAAAAVSLAVTAISGCGVGRPPVPDCGDLRRMGLVAQSVPTASYLPCTTALPSGWRVTGFTVRTGDARFDLRSDRERRQPVRIELTAQCDIAGASVQPARATGSRAYLRLRSITPRYAGTLYDVYPGGCVRSSFDFERGPHIVLLDELQQSTGLLSRRELRLQLRRTLGVELD